MRYLKYVTLFSFALLGLAWAWHGASSSHAAETPITYSNQVARIIQENCTHCHRPDGGAPFAMTDYDETAPRAHAIVSAVSNYRMPRAASARLHTGCTTADTFEGIRRLSPEEIAVLRAWAEAGAPQGDPADLPPPQEYHTHEEEWKAGEPDFVFANTPGGFNVPPRLNEDFFRRFPLKTNWEADRFLTGMEVLPGTGDKGRQVDVVHHVALFIDPTGRTLEMEKEFQAKNPKIPGPGFEGFDSEFSEQTKLVGMWFPGITPLQMQEGAGIRIPRGGVLVMEVHYTTWHEEDNNDLTLMGLKFAHTPVYHERITERFHNINFTIPAGAENYKITASGKLKDDATIFSWAPHGHQFVTDFYIEATLPNGEKRCMLDVEYQFKHQGIYIYKEPIKLPAGTEIKLTGTYNNSENFVRQMNFPPKDIPFGRTSDKEMCQIVFGLSYDNQRLTPSTPRIGAIRRRGEELMVSGQDLQPGAFIELNGKLLLDTQMGKEGDYVYSSAEWQANDHGHEEDFMKIAVVNADGGRSQVRLFIPRHRGNEDGSRTKNTALFEANRFNKTVAEKLVSFTAPPTASEAAHCATMAKH